MDVSVHFLAWPRDGIWLLIQMIRKDRKGHLMTDLRGLRLRDKEAQSVGEGLPFLHGTRVAKFFL